MYLFIYAKTFIIRLYRDFRDVFNKAQTNQLPHFQSYNHTIELKLDFILKNYKIYLLILKKEEALNIFL